MRHDDARHALYVSVPSTRETFAVRRLPPSLTVSTLRARLELCAGLATGTYVLRHGRTPLADDARLTFGENVANGAVLTAVFEARWVRVYGGVVGGAGGGRQRRGGAETPHPPDSHAPDVSERRFVALFALSHRGLHPAVQRLISLGEYDNLLHLYPTSTWSRYGTIVTSMQLGRTPLLTVPSLSDRLSHSPPTSSSVFISFYFLAWSMG